MEGGVDATEEEKEMLALLEMLKETQPEKYEAIMKEMQAQVGGFKPKMPGSETVLGDGGLESKSREEGIDIIPDAGFVVKTQQTAGPSAGRKVFVNICSSSHVAQPATKKKLDDEGNETEGMNVPLSMGPPKPDKDRSGKPCVVYDVIVHPDVIDDSGADKTGTFRHFLCELALNYLEQKYKSPVSHQYKLPKMKYKGDKVTPQRIRARKTPVIEEVPDTPSATSAAPHRASSSSASAPAAGRVGAAGGRAAGGAAGASASSSTAPSAPRAATAPPPPPQSFIKYTTVLKDGAGRLVSDGTDAATVTVSFDVGDVPDGDSAAIAGSIQVDVAEELLHVSCPGYRATDAVLPCVVDTEQKDLQAAFDPLARLLHVTLTTVAPQSVSEGRYAPDKGSKPWLLAAALSSGGPDGDLSSSSSAGASASSASASHKAQMETPFKAEEELPEDRFHRADIVSSHILQQKAKEAEERLKRQEEQAKAKAKAKAEAKAKAKAQKGNTAKPVNPAYPEVEEESMEDLIEAQRRKRDPAAETEDDLKFEDDGKDLDLSAALDLL